MPDIQTYLGNVHVINGRIHAPHENEPGQYSDRGYPYLNVASTRYFQEYAKYASDYFYADAQGLNPNDGTAWERVTLRMADLVKTSAAMQRQFDDYKMVLLDKMKYAYIPRGAKFVTMGSTWLCTNPENISGSDGMGVIQRCKAVWNHLDWYGNVVSEPMAVEGTEILRANAPDPQYNMPVVKGYYNVKCQYNEDTAQIDDNTRMILGSSCYIVTGFSDFNQEFTGDYTSVRMLEFTIRKDEINDATDDRENHVAGGKTFSWDIIIAGKPAISVGNTTPLSVSSMRCGSSADGDADHPVSYIWESSDESVATVDENGIVTGVSEGNCTISATLTQNPSYSENFAFSVLLYDSGIQWASTPPERMTAYQTADMEVQVPEGSGPVEWVLSGADTDAYSWTANGTSIQIKCWSGSISPLVVTAFCGTESVAASIPLCGI